MSQKLIRPRTKHCLQLHQYALFYVTKNANRKEEKEANKNKNKAKTITQESIGLLKL